MEKIKIPKSKDWATDTPDPKINAFRELMAQNVQYVDDPYLGIFWYDPNKKDLFGVVKTLAEKEDYYKSNLFNCEVKTCSTLHYKVWDQMYRRHRVINKDHTLMPRGRIFEIKDNGFIVCVGSWINKYPEAKKMILDEFMLPENTEFNVDEHWDIGHGWSDKDM